MLGCGGFVGSHLLDRCLSHGLGGAVPEVVGWDLDDRKIRHLVHHPNFIFRQGNCADPDARGQLLVDLRDADVVLNLAAICNPAQYNTQPYQVIRANFVDTFDTVQMCAEAGTWLLHFSTSEVYGRTLSSYVDDSYADPALYELEEDSTPLVMGPVANQRWSYACAKQLMERFIYGCHTEFGLRFTIVRPLNFFGPRMDFIPGREGEGVPRVLACFLGALLDRKPMLLVDGGMARRTIVGIGDAVDAVVRMLERPDAAANQVFNVGNRANEVTMRGLAEMMRRIYADVSGDVSYLSHPIEDVSSAEFYGAGYEDCDRRMPNLAKARRLLDWEPRMPLEDVLRETIQYYYEKYGTGRAAATRAA